jgi:hypothetical protein
MLVVKSHWTDLVLVGPADVAHPDADGVEDAVAPAAVEFLPTRTPPGYQKSSTRTSTSFEGSTPMSATASMIAAD